MLSIIRSFIVARTYTFNSITLLLSDGDCLCTWRKRGVVITILTQKTEELVGVLCDQLSKVRIASPKLLQNGLQHLRLLLNDLAKLLKLSIIAKEVEVAKTLAASSSGSHSGSSRSWSSTATSTAAGASTALLRSKVEEVDIAIIVTSGSRSGSGGGLSGGGPGLLCRCRTQILGDTLHHVSHLLKCPTSLFMLTLRRYSTARSGLKKAARMAASI